MILRVKTVNLTVKRRKQTIEKVYTADKILDRSVEFSISLGLEAYIVPSSSQAFVFLKVSSSEFWIKCLELSKVQNPMKTLKHATKQRMNSLPET